MIEISRRLEFDAAHRVLGHEGKCRYLHGHRYVAEITVSPRDEMNPLGMVIDYGVIKEMIGSWIDFAWDHNVLLHPGDPLLHESKCNFLANEKPPFVMPDETPNPTAENIAMVLFGVAKHYLEEKGVRVRRVRIYETPNCYADYSEELQ